MNPIYVRAAEGGFFHREHIEPFGYSDGSEEEQRLFSIVAGASDVSTFSSELAGAITDWPSEYHLTRARHCLIRPLDIKPGDRVLELGCGCGAITRFLGESGAQVTAVEGSVARARIAAQRCRDLQNVQVVVDDLLRFESTESFDWVLLIGVLEYASIYGSATDPVLDYLTAASRYLDKQGRLVVAIENKLGLKYFNGCAEDHLGVPYLGLQGLYGDRGPRTFGRRELSAHLRRSGLIHQNFLFPFPDYKLPSVIISEAALDDPGLNAADLLARSHARDYSGVNVRAFDDALVVAGLHENGLLGDLSNSFLVMASATEASVKSPFMASSYAVRRRHEAYCTETSFISRAGGYEVVKSALRVGCQPPSVVLSDGAGVSQQLLRQSYTHGRILLWRLLAARAGKGGMAATVVALEPWFDYLLESATRPAGDAQLAAMTVPGHFLDCTPANLLESADGLVFIDQEWVADRPVSLGWVVCRGLINVLAKGVSIRSSRASMAEVFTALARSRSLEVTREDIAGWLVEESAFQMAITAEQVDFDMDAMLGGPLISANDRFLELRESARKTQQALAEAVRKRDHAMARMQSLKGQLDHVRRKSAVRISALERTIDDFGLSTSWRVTKPLRLIKRLLAGQAGK